MHLTRLLERYGYALLFVLVAVESLGIPVPGETALIAAAALAARGHLDIALVVIAAAAGAIFGDNTGYWIGRKGGLALLHRYRRVLRVRDAQIERIHAFFERHGAKTVFFGRFVSLLRTWAALFAGVGEMHYGEFTVYNAVGGIVWAGIVGAIGYLFGQNLHRLEDMVSRASWALAVVVAVGVVAWWWWKRRSASRAASGEPREEADSR